MPVGTNYASVPTSWLRYDNTDANISYINMVAGSNGDTTNFLNGNYISTVTSTLDSYVKFNFIGSQFRLLNQCYIDGRNQNLNITIDSILYNASAPNAYIGGHVCYYESPVLTSGQHNVSIKHAGTSAGFLFFDCIDIYSNGTLNPYNNGYFLIKQSNSYYSIKSTYYDATNKVYIPLVLSGGTVPNKADIELYGFTNVTDLITSVTIGTETFKPIDKLYSNFQIKRYKTK